MSAKNNAKGSFTSFRIIGEKAQKLLAQARKIKQESQLAKDATPLPVEVEEHPEIIVHLSIPSVVKAAFTILAIGLGVLAAYILMDKIVLLLLAIFLAAIIDPGVKAMSKVGIPRGFGILIHYFVALFLCVFLLISLIPIIALQVTELAGLLNDQVNDFLANPSVSLPLLTDDVNARLTVFVETTLRDLSITQFADALEQFGQNLSIAAQGSFTFAAHLAGSVLGFFVNFILVLVIAFFLQIEKERIIAWLRGFLPRRYRLYVDDKSEVISWKLAQWVRGQLILCCSIGTLVFFALLILRMPYALTLGLLAGFTEFIPYVGPWIAAAPAILIAWTQGGFFWAVIVLLVYYAIQVCENNVLVPLIMKRAVGLSATAIIFAMLVGISFPFIIHPVLGIILSIPTTTIIALFLEDWREMRRRERSIASEGR